MSLSLSLSESERARESERAGNGETLSPLSGKPSAFVSNGLGSRQIAPPAHVINGPMPACLPPTEQRQVRSCLTTHVASANCRNNDDELPPLWLGSWIVQGEASWIALDCPPARQGPPPPPQQPMRNTFPSLEKGAGPKGSMPKRRLFPNRRRSTSTRLHYLAQEFLRWSSRSPPESPINSAAPQSPRAALPLHWPPANRGGQEKAKTFLNRPVFNHRLSDDTSHQFAIVETSGQRAHKKRKDAPVATKATESTPRRDTMETVLLLTKFPSSQTRIGLCPYKANSWAPASAAAAAQLHDLQDRATRGAIATPLKTSKSKGSIATTAPVPSIA
ncbi:hypothetical protein IWX46DRAFT_629184 [Phyllosticta citricarpa]|uniref:Uncharacterized protein n=1 Tax=Phyllosticta citricarpa TaxID=55181 RepID=A0ABR1LRT3_9PEZI